MDINTQEATGRSTRKTMVIGGVIGATALAASVGLLAASAGAATPTVTVEQFEPGADAPPADVVVEIDDADFELPEEFAAADQCVNDVFAKFGLNLDDTISDDEIIELSEADWEAFDAEAEKCNDLLPPEIRAQVAADNAAWDAYDTCVTAALEDAGIDLDIDEAAFDDFADEEFVSIVDSDEATFASFGDGAGTITITKVGDDITVTTDGDVQVESIDIGEFDEDGNFEVFPEDAEFENAIQSCDDLVPEGFDDIFASDVYESEVLEN